MKTYDSVLANLPLFENIQQQDINSMLHCMGAQIVKYAKEEYIRMEGAPADFIGIVLEGTIQIQQHDYDGNRTITASFCAGEMFGEAFACAEIPALPVDILAVAPVTVMFLRKENLLHPCENVCCFHSQMIQNLIKIIARKNMILNRKLGYLSRKTTREKLLAYLKDQARQNHSSAFTIPYNRQELADYLGVERSAMSSELSKLQKAGILETNRSFFRLLGTTDNSDSTTIP